MTDNLAQDIRAYKELEGRIYSASGLDLFLQGKKSIMAPPKLDDVVVSVDKLLQHNLDAAEFDALQMDDKAINAVVHLHRIVYESGNIQYGYFIFGDAHNEHKGYVYQYNKYYFSFLEKDSNDVNTLLEHCLLAANVYLFMEEPDLRMVLMNWRKDIFDSIVPADPEEFRTHVPILLRIDEILNGDILSQ